LFSSGGLLSAVPNGTTWQFYNKNYTLDIDSSKIFDYGIEKPITITGNVRDRNNNLSTFTRTINSPV
jgi:hypothetical protein